MAGRLLVFAATCVLLYASAAALPPPLVFHVGGSSGWTVPAGNDTDTYNYWATKNRFQVGDILYFKYVKDSVLLVRHDDYKLCSTARPVRRFTDGATKVRFDRYGFFYFISGEPGHCAAGQRLVVRVMVPPKLSAGPAIPPAGSSSGSATLSWFSSGSSPSPSPSTLGQASGASRQVLGGSYIVGLLAGVTSVFVLV